MNETEMKTTQSPSVNKFCFVRKSVAIFLLAEMLIILFNVICMNIKCQVLFFT